MSALVLVPAVYRCPDHDNVEIVTARVHDRVAREALIRSDLARSAFRVSVTCPGPSGDAAGAHTRVCEGTWRSGPAQTLPHAS